MLSLKKQQQIKTKLSFVIVCFTLVLSFSLLNSTAQNTVYTPLYTSGNFVKTIDFTKPVGEIAGNVSATASGGISYSIPIFTCPGTNGMQPSVSLNYNSQASSGIAGYGWSIQGLSAITRTGKNLYHNSSVSPVNYTAANDAFLLDGIRLNAISGGNGNNGTIYATEAESFAKIISHGGSFPDNPDWFQVTAKDGSVTEYGNSTTSKLLAENQNDVMMWRINKMIDVNGNYIEFIYNNTNRDSRIEQILYTGNNNTGLVPYNKINFTYSIRADKNTVYEAGASQTTQYLLDKIAVVHTNDANTDETVKTYRLNYGFDNINSMLKEVVEYGGDENSVSLNSTIFLYGDEPQNIVTSSTNLFQGPVDCYSGDFDADGRTDLMAAAKYYDPNYGIFLNTGYSLYRDIDQSSAVLMYIKQLPQGSNVQIPGLKFFNFLTSDYDGDGRDDVLNTRTSIINNERVLNSIEINYTKSFNPSTGYTDYVPVNYPAPPPANNTNKIHSSGNFFIPGDFDGNGNQDYIVMTGNANNSNFYTAYLTSTSTSEINSVISNFGIGPNNFPNNYAETVANADKINIIDLDGDGKSEILVTKDQTTYVLSIQKIGTGSYSCSILFSTNYITKFSRCFQGDFNGDKKTDILVRNSNGSWNILYSTGLAFNIGTFAFNETVVLNGNISDDKIVVADFNGDGKSDVAHGFLVWINGTASSSKFSLYYSKGQPNTAFYFEQYLYNKLLASDDLITGDFNGDGRTDLFNRINSVSPADFIAFKPFGQDKLLKKITTGHNITTSFEYKLLTNTDYPYFYERTVSLDGPPNGNPFNYVQPPVYALSSLTIPDGTGGNNITDYTYQNAVVHRHAKGFLGFKKVTAENNVSGITTITENEINTQFAVGYGVKQRTHLTSTNQPLSESIITTSFQNLSTGSYDIRYLQKNDQTLSIDYLNNKASQAINTYDNYSNITSSTTTVGYYIGGNTVVPIETTVSSSTFSIHNTPVPAKPDNVTVTNTRTGMPSITTTTAFTYTSNGLTASQTDFSGLPKAVTTTTTYNSFGNPITSTITAAGLNSRYANSTYDAKGRFALTIQKTGVGLSQTESNTVSSKWGKPLTKTTTDCLTTTNEYDAFGRLIHTIMPDGNEATITDYWQVSDVYTIPNPHRLFYTKTHYLGSKPDTKHYVDKFGHNWLQQTASMYGPNGSWHTMRTTYDNRGNVKTKTNLYFPFVFAVEAIGPQQTSSFTQPVETPRITTYNYDAYNRLSTISNDIGTQTYSYSLMGNGVMQTTVTDMAGQNSSQITDAAGRVIGATDNGGQLDFNFDSRGNKKDSKLSGTIFNSSQYDVYGKQTSITDINAGTTTYNYDAFGQLKQQTDALGNQYNMNYDDFGRIINRTGTEGTTTYEYYSISGCSNDNITKITGFNGVVKEYTYDALKRLVSETQTIDATTYTTSYTYTNFGQLAQTTYPSGVNVFQTYDASGYLTKVYHTGAFPKNSIFQNGWVDGEGKYLTYGLGFNKTTNNTYNKGFPATTVTSGIQDMAYNFDLQSGNLLQRTDNLKSQTESFTYDNLNRLLTSTPNSTQQLGITYDVTGVNSLGNIVAKTDAGYYKYRNDKIHAVAYTMNQPVPGQSPVTPVPVSATPLTEQLITYTPFQKTASITEDSKILNFTYGPDYQRVKTELVEYYNNITEKRYYLGDYEKQVISGVVINTREIHYINGGNGLCAILVKDDGVLQPSYIIYPDHLGSLTTVANQSSTAIIAEQSFDAWGRRRDPNNWNNVYPANVNYALPTWLYRGYTGHESLPHFSLVNMNGRIYDPVLGRMLSPDNLVQEPMSTQNYNRYSYCINNPLKYTDPSGNIIVVDSWLRGFVRGLFKGGFKGAWNEANKYAGNDAKLWGGLFTGSFKQIISRFTWESPQTMLGFGVSQAYLHGGRVEDVSYYGGATIVRHPKANGLGMTLGSYINGDNTIRPDPNNALFQHEYGHYLQSQVSGVSYLARFAIPSLLSKNKDAVQAHVYNPVEQDANVRAIEYFFNRTGGSFNWRFRDNPIGAFGIGTGWTMADYNTINFQQLLYLSRLQGNIGDFFGLLGPGIINAIRHNRTY